MARVRAAGWRTTCDGGRAADYHCGSPGVSLTQRAGGRSGGADCWDQGAGATVRPLTHSLSRPPQLPLASPKDPRTDRTNSAATIVSQRRPHIQLFTLAHLSSPSLCTSLCQRPQPLSPRTRTHPLPCLSRNLNLPPVPLPGGHKGECSLERKEEEAECLAPATRTHEA